MPLDIAAIEAQARSMSLDDIDVLADTWGRRVPHAELLKLRREAPVFWHAEPNDTGFWAVTGYDDIVAISRDHATYSTELGGTFIPTQDPNDLLQMQLSILNMDPPRHDRMRKLISAGFTPRQIRGLIEKISHHATEIVDGLDGLAEIEFVDAISARLPIQMICEMLGVPQEDCDQMRLWSDLLVGFDDPELSQERDVQVATAIAMFQYCDDLVKEKRANPGDDILSTLVHAEVDGDRLNDLELNLFFVTLVIAGNETTRNLISHGMLALFEHPDQLGKLQANPDTMPKAVDEMLRWGSSIQNFRRTVTADTELGGQRIAAGDKVVTFYLSGNFDETHFDAPFAFQVDRDPNHHVTFGGGGIHFCLGAHLARTEIGAMVGEVIRRYPDIQLAGEPVRLRSDFINGLKRLPVSLGKPA